LSRKIEAAVTSGRKTDRKRASFLPASEKKKQIEERETEVAAKKNEEEK
jgi:hypothetical protein